VGKYEAAPHFSFSRPRLGTFSTGLILVLCVILMASLLQGCATNNIAEFERSSSAGEMASVFLPLQESPELPLSVTLCQILPTGEVIP
jgi:hypothetical protein